MAPPLLRPTRRALRCQPWRVVEALGRASTFPPFALLPVQHPARAMSRLSLAPGLEPEMSTRGEHLLRADRGFATGGGLLAHLAAPAFAKLLDELDRRLASGGIDATLPDASERRIGFHAKGPRAVVRLSSWRALVRLATSGSVGWYNAWTLGEWSSPDPVAVFELFSANAVALGNVA